MGADVGLADVGVDVGVDVDLYVGEFVGPFVGFEVGAFVGPVGSAVIGWVGFGVGLTVCLLQLFLDLLSLFDLLDLLDLLVLPFVLYFVNFPVLLLSSLPPLAERANLAAGGRKLTCGRNLPLISNSSAEVLPNEKSANEVTVTVRLVV